MREGIIKFPGGQETFDYHHSFGVWYVVDRENGKVMRIETPKSVSGEGHSFQINFQKGNYILVGKNDLEKRRVPRNLLGRLMNLSRLSHYELTLLEQLAGEK